MRRKGRKVALIKGFRSPSPLGEGGVRAMVATGCASVGDEIDGDLPVRYASHPHPTSPRGRGELPVLTSSPKPSSPAFLPKGRRELNLKPRRPGLRWESMLIRADILTPAQGFKPFAAYARRWLPQ